MKARFAAFAAGLMVITAAAASSAEPMDPALERMVLHPECHTQPGNVNFGQYNDSPGNLARLASEQGGADWCLPDNAAFARMMSQYGFAFAPTAMHTARTTGFGGFHFGFEADFTKISPDDMTPAGVQYLHEGTQGSVDTSSNKDSIVNSSPDSMLSLFSVDVRKSFGFGLELTGMVGFMPDTSLLSGGADVRMSLLEGFRKGIPGFIPDIAVGGGVRTITGTPEFQLTDIAIDVEVSKPLPIADTWILTPWLGYQYLWIDGDSGLVDFTPATSPTGYCNYAGSNVPSNPAAPKSGTYDGQPVCEGGSPLDFNNNAVFDKVRLHRQRLMFGANFRWEMISFTGEFITDLVSPQDAQPDGNPAKAELAGQPRQWTLAFELGTSF
jgi:hypothetical protein